VLIEEFIKGRELTMGAYKQHNKIITLPPTEIISKNAFFDYEAKYTTGVTDEITPAQIDNTLLELMQRKTIAIYNALNLRGLVRIDFIYNADKEALYFLEVNTMPGQSENSLVPQQVRAAGMDLKDFYGSLIEEVFRNKVS
jgi:D-alanine-D-alanine ligase